MRQHRVCHGGGSQRQQPAGVDAATGAVDAGTTGATSQGVGAASVPAAGADAGRATIGVEGGVLTPQRATSGRLRRAAATAAAATVGAPSLLPPAVARCAPPVGRHRRWRQRQRQWRRQPSRGGKERGEPAGRCPAVAATTVGATATATATAAGSKTATADAKPRTPRVGEVATTARPAPDAVHHDGGGAAAAATTAIRRGLGATAATPTAVGAPAQLGR